MLIIHPVKCLVKLLIHFQTSKVQSIHSRGAMKRPETAGTRPWLKPSENSWPSSRTKPTDREPNWREKSSNSASICGTTLKLTKNTRGLCSPPGGDWPDDEAGTSTQAQATLARPWRYYTKKSNHGFSEDGPKKPRHGEEDRQTAENFWRMRTDQAQGTLEEALPPRRRTAGITEKLRT